MATTTTHSPSTAGKQPTGPDPDRPPICAAPATLPTSLALTALRYANRPDIDPIEVRDVRCTLQAHPTGDHYAFIVDTTATTSAWTRWNHNQNPHIVLVLPDCPTRNPDQDTTCSEYELHHGGHTWQVNDPWNPPGPAQ
jgi:hypothetical protein